MISLIFNKVGLNLSKRNQTRHLSMLDLLLLQNQKSGNLRSLIQMEGPLPIKIKVTHPIAELKPKSNQHKRKNIAQLVL